MTLHRLAPRIDTGAILVQEPVSLPADVTATRASVLLYMHGRTMLETLLDDIARAGAIPEGRNAPVLPYCPFPHRRMLRDLRRRGLKLTDIRDLRDAMSLSGGRKATV